MAWSGFWIGGCGMRTAPHRMSAGSQIKAEKNAQGPELGGPERKTTFIPGVLLSKALRRRNVIAVIWVRRNRFLFEGVKVTTCQRYWRFAARNSQEYGPHGSRLATKVT